MFWRVPGYSQPSPLEAILDLDNFTLEEVLDEADLIQECKSLNGRLVNFLKEPSTLRALLSYIVDTPAPGADEKQHQKNSFKSCEVLCCEVNEMYSVLMREEDLLEKLFSFLDNTKPLNLTRAGYFARVVSCLLMKRASEVLAFLESRRSIVDKLLEHLDTTSTAEVLCSVAGADERTAPNLTTPQLQWLAETNFMAGLVEQLRSQGNRDAGSNARTVLVGVARSPLSSPLLQPLLDPALFQPLLDSAFTAPVSVQTMDVLIALLKPKQEPSRYEMQQQEPGGSANVYQSAFADASSSASAELDASVKQATMQGVVGKLPELAELLDADRAEGPDLTAPQDTPYGMLSPPLGQARLKAVEVLYSILGLSDPAAEQGVMDSLVIQHCLRLFIQYPFNNLLHHRVAGLMLTALERGSDEFLRYLFGPCQLIQWLTQAPDLVTPASRSSDSKAEARAPLRAGYMGHITALANKLTAMADERPVISEALEGSLQWKEWWDTVLQPRNEFEDVNRWACGRPSMQEMSTRAASQEDPMIEDIEGMPGSAAPNHLQSHRYAGFAENGDDDSDEEEDIGHTFEMQQGDDTIFQDAAATFRILKLNDSYPAEGEAGNDDSSSSSSSNDEGDVTLRMPASVVMQRRLSDDEDMVVMDMDDYGVVVGSSGFGNTNGAPPRLPFAASQDPWKAFPDPPAAANEAPQEAGWADFEGATPFNALPSEPAWASFEDRGGSNQAQPSLSAEQQHEADQQQQHQERLRGAVPMQSAGSGPAPDAHQHSPPIDIPMSHGQHTPPEEVAELDEFSSFNYWRSPPAMLVDDADLAADSADADSAGADSAESPAESPDAVEHPL